MNKRQINKRIKKIRNNPIDFSKYVLGVKDLKVWQIKCMNLIIKNIKKKKVEFKEATK